MGKEQKWGEEMTNEELMKKAEELAAAKLAEERIREIHSLRQRQPEKKAEEPQPSLFDGEQRQERKPIDKVYTELSLLNDVEKGILAGKELATKRQKKSSYVLCSNGFITSHRIKVIFGDAACVAVENQLEHSFVIKRGPESCAKKPKFFSVEKVRTFFGDKFFFRFVKLKEAPKEMLLTQILLWLSGLQGSNTDLVRDFIAFFKIQPCSQNPTKYPLIEIQEKVSVLCEKTKQGNPLTLPCRTKEEGEEK